MILCKDIESDALLHVISLVDWPKHVKSFLGDMVIRDSCDSSSHTKFAAE